MNSTLKEIVTGILLESEGFVTSNGAFGPKMSLERTAKGEQYVEEKSDGGINEFPEDPSNPVIGTAEVYSGDTVNENIEFEKIGKETAQRKLAGYEMEGYSFLYSAQENLPRAHRLFAKGVSDLGTSRSKMDYYQPYCAASAMAVVFHLFKGRDFLFSIRSTYSRTQKTSNFAKLKSLSLFRIVGHKWYSNGRFCSDARNR